MKDKLRDGINRILFHILSNEERADKIAELIAPELEAARKWRKFEREIIGSDQNNEALKKLVFGQKNLPADVAKLINENFDGLK